MINYFLQRFSSGIIVILFVSIFIFSVMRMIPGDPLDVIYGTKEAISPETRVALEHKLGLDQPLISQYIRWITRFFIGDWGTSYSKGLPVFDLIIQKMPWTFFLVIASMIPAIVIAIPLGTIAATKPNSMVDFILLGITYIGQSIPNYWLGIMLILLFALKLRWLPSFGAENPLKDPIDALRHVIMPSLTLGVGIACTLVRVFRSSVLEEISKDYVLTAKAKGMSSHKIIYKHVLKNVAIPFITIISLWFGVSMSGSVIIENIFAWPGVGQLLFQAILSRDYPVVQSVVFIVSLIIVVVNSGTDILYTLFDPRVSFTKKEV